MAVDYTPTMKPYNNVGAFRYWCQTTIPLVYDDSKSYMELLYSVIHYLNSTIKDVANMGDNVDALLEAYNQLQGYVNDYFDNLDVQEEINQKLDEMASSGDLDNLLEPFVQTFVGDWLGENLTPTSPPIDGTLTIENAGADSKKVGDNFAPTYSPALTYTVGQIVKYDGQLYRCITEITTAEQWDSSKWETVSLSGLYKEIFDQTETFVLPANADINDLQQGRYYAPAGWDITNLPPFPGIERAWLIFVFTSGNLTGNIAYKYGTVNETSTAIMVRFKLNETWYPWQYATDIHIPGWSNSTLNDYVNEGKYLFTDALTGVTGIPDGITLPFMLRVERVENVLYQTIITWRSDKVLKRRALNNSTWSAWAYYNARFSGVGRETDLNNYRSDGDYLLIDSYTYTNLPASIPAFLTVKHVDTGVLQIVTSWDAKDVYIRRIFTTTGAITAWNKVSVTNAVARNTDLNTYRSTGNYLATDAYTYTNAPVNPPFMLSVRNVDNITYQSITTWGADAVYMRRIFASSSGDIFTAWNNITGGQSAVLAPTGNSADRTADIRAKLTTYGKCELLAGDYYVSNLVMPEGTTIRGAGDKTRIILSGTSDGYAVQMKSSCTVESVLIEGNTSGITLSSIIGGRHGILWDGSTEIPKTGFVSNVFIHGFTGGGITCRETGYGTEKQIIAVNVKIENCNAGIYIPHWSEFNKFTNARVAYCFYGCVNNGGNNIFVNCDFSNSVVGFLMDNTDGQAINNSHGSCVGCTFNHMDSNTGTAIKIIDCDSGYMFTGCQIFFGKTEVTESDGVVFNACNYGFNNCNITVTGGGAVLFNACMMQDKAPITVTGNQNVHFVNCYNRSTGAVIEP